MATVILSPHPDDAVLSCWHLLEGEDVTVVTVFAGVPEEGTTGWWDLLTGASESSARVRERRREDARALSQAGAASVTLDLLDAQYRPSTMPGVTDAIAEHVEGADAVYAPLGVFLNPDHAAVREAACELRADARLYADHPHVGIWGLPAWVTGNGASSGLDVDGAWRLLMRNAGIDADRLRPAVRELDSAGFERKLAAVRAYETQLEALEREAPLDQLRWEVTWTP